MLTFLGFSMIVVFMYLIMSKRLSAMNALTIVPVVFALLAGFTNIGDMMVDGILRIAPTAVMVTFSILYFAILIDSGMFDPIVNKIVKLVKGDPLKITIGTAVTSIIVALDGDGTITYLVVVTAFLPLYEKLKMNKLILACLPAMAIGIMNILPWGGPFVRLLAIFDYDVMEILGPLLPSLIAGALYVLGLGVFFGFRERKRLGITKIDDESKEVAATLTADEKEKESLKRPKLVWFNFIFTIIVMTCLITSLLPIGPLFMIATVVVSVVNFPNPDTQKQILQSHAGNILTVVTLIFAAGIFSGILEGTGMVTSMANALTAITPDSLGPYLAGIVAVTSMPFTFFMANDPYYLGVIPVIAETAASFGVSPLEVAQASLLGQPLHLLSPLVGSVYVLIGLLGLDLRDHIKFSVKYAAGTSIVMIIVAYLFGTLT